MAMGELDDAGMVRLGNATRLQVGATVVRQQVAQGQDVAKLTPGRIGARGGGRWIPSGHDHQCLVGKLGQQVFPEPDVERGENLVGVYENDGFLGVGQGVEWLLALVKAETEAHGAKKIGGRSEERRVGK